MHVRHCGRFAYVDGELADGDSIKLMRLRYGGSATTWGFALYLDSTDKYEDTILPTCTFAGTAEDALDCTRDFRSQPLSEPCLMRHQP
ncbi:hypothetical protein [Streptomyces xantholiticus]|uniref:Uncharacterized protein n=1 Tax=Streptomyces xantholiticus TaxID=68285 RepID=A0ABV1V5N3_9ACTN